MVINVKELTYATVKNGIEVVEQRQEKIKWRRRWTRIGVGFCIAVLIFSVMTMSLMDIPAKTQKEQEMAELIVFYALMFMFIMTGLTVIWLQIDCKIFICQEEMSIEEELNDIRGAIFLLNCDENEKEELREKLEEIIENEGRDEEEYDEV